MLIIKLDYIYQQYVDVPEPLLAYSVEEIYKLPTTAPYNEISEIFTENIIQNKIIFVKQEIFKRFMEQKFTNF